MTAYHSSYDYSHLHQNHHPGILRQKINDSTGVGEVDEKMSDVMNVQTLH